MHRPGTQGAGELITGRLRQLSGVRWAEINGSFGRMVVGYDPELVDVAELVGTVAAGEVEFASAMYQRFVRRWRTLEALEQAS